MAQNARGLTIYWAKNAGGADFAQKNQSKNMSSAKNNK